MVLTSHHMNKPDFKDIQAAFIEDYKMYTAKFITIYTGGYYLQSDLNCILFSDIKFLLLQYLTQKSKINVIQL